MTTPLSAENKEKHLPPSIVANYYYDYTSETIEKLRTLQSDFTMTKESLQKWDAVLDELIKNHPTIEGGIYRIAAYLYTAQRDAAFLSFDAMKTFQGSLDPITIAIIRLFYPFFTPSFPIEADEYSYKLAQIVFQNFKLRFEQENTDIYKETKIVNIFAWTGQSLEYNKSTLNWTPWVISPISFESNPLSEIVEKEKIEEKALNRESTPLNKKNNWLYIANNYFYSEDISFDKVVFTRSLLALALYNAIITNTKLHYFYDVKQLYIDKNLEIPSLESTLAYTAVSILTYYFPKEKARWLEIATKQL